MWYGWSAYLEPAAGASERRAELHVGELRRIAPNCAPKRRIARGAQPLQHAEEAGEGVGGHGEALEHAGVLQHVVQQRRQLVLRELEEVEVERVGQVAQLQPERRQRDRHHLERRVAVVLRREEGGRREAADEGLETPVGRQPRRRDLRVRLDLLQQRLEPGVGGAARRRIFGLVGHRAGALAPRGLLDGR